MSDEQFIKQAKADWHLADHWEKKVRAAQAELKAAQSVVQAARHWQRAWEQRRQRTGRFTADEEILSDRLDDYFHYELPDDAVKDEASQR